MSRETVGTVFKYQKRDRKSRFSGRGTKALGVCALLVFAVVGSYFLIGGFAIDAGGKSVDWAVDMFAPPVHADNGRLSLQALLQINGQHDVKARQDEALEFLAKCEGEGSSPLQYDNKKDGSLKGIMVASVGDFRFKVGTVQIRASQLQAKHLSELEATYVALDHAQAQELARQELFYSNIDWTADWVNCSASQHSFHGQTMTLEEVVKAIKSQMN